MGRTLPSITMEYMAVKAAFRDYQKALARSDQRALDELFSFAQVHLAEAAYAANPLPMETFFLAMMLEEHKRVLELNQKIEKLVNGQERQE
jgi:hypothetical protein